MSRANQLIRQRGLLKSIPVSIIVKHHINIFRSKTVKLKAVWIFAEKKSMILHYLRGYYSTMINNVFKCLIFKGFKP